MASNEVSLKIKVGDDGTLDIVAKKAEKAAKATDKIRESTDSANKSRNRYNKTEKGVGQLTNNSTKAFSKQASAINSGLVPAYATLAANVFAISAAFNVLSRSAELRTLEEGFTRLGNSVGQTAKLISASIVEITDGAVSMDEAVRSAAAGFSAGFSTQEITGLAEVAKNASIALGRDMADSLGRLTRGVAKLEPEILDELGIFIRLDDAAEKYALQLGVAASSLTQTERRQAFLNEALLQGQRKFAAVSGEVDPNPFNQLAASFQNLTHSILSFVNGALGPLIRLLADNSVALVGALTLFGAGVAKSMLPALTQLGEKAKFASEQQQKLADQSAISASAQVKSSQKTIRSMKKIGKDNAFNELKKKISSGKASTEELKAAIKSLETQESRRAKNLEAEHVKDRERKEEELESIRKLQVETKKLMKAKEGNLKSQVTATGARRDARTEGRLAESIENISMEGPIQGFKTAKKELKAYEVQTAASMKRQGKFTKGLSGMQHVLKNFPFIFKTAGAAARLFGAALINAIPVIGQFIFLAGLALEGLIKLAGSFTLTSAATAKFRTVTGTLDEKVKQLNQTNAQLEEKFLAAEAAAVQITPVIYKTGEAAAEAAAEILKNATATAQLNARVQEVQNTYKVAAGVTNEFVASLNAFNKELAESKPGFFLTLGVAVKTLFNEGLAVVINKVSGAIEIVGQKFTAAKDSIVGFIDGAVKKFTETFPDVAKAMGIVADGIGDTLEGAKATVADLAKGITDDVVGMINGVENAYARGQETARKDRFLSETQDRLDELQAKAEGNKKLQGIFEGFIAELGEGGLSGALERAIARTGNLDAAFGEVAAILANGSRRINSTSDAINNFGEQFKQTQEVFSKFSQGFDKKNPFVELSESIDKSIRTLEQMKEKTDGDDAIQISFKDLIEKEGPQLKAAFEALGLSLEEVEQKGAEALQPLAKDVKEAILIQEELKDKVAQAKAEVKQLAAAFRFEQAERALERVNTLIKNGQELNSSQQFDTNGLKRLQTEYEARLDFIEDEAAAKKKVIDEEIKLQQKILQIRLKLAGLDPSKEAEVQALIDSLEDATTARKDALDQEADTKTLESTTNYLKEQVRLRKQIVGEIGNENTSLDRRALLLGQTDFSIRNEKGEVIDKGTTEKIAALKALTAGMLEDLSKLGPDGEVAAAVGQAGFTIAESFDNMFETFETGKTKMEKFGAAAAAVASTIGAVNSIIQQQSAATIAGIDKQIEAEKKRDGKSAASVERLRALEKKKDQEKRKAFETNKKMLMAQAIATTAAGVAGALAIKTPYELPIGLIAAGIIGAMGAAQLAIIAGTSYNGGGSSGGSNIPSSVSVGQRKSSVDMAKSQGGGGELAYFRGGKGVGGPENFTPAFAGYRNRAEGGNTAFMVGEQGPELFVPEKPGRVVPNDDIQAATPINANINISAVDAAGVEDVLMNQRGNIISMIREAANAQGNTFLEDINVAEL